MAPREVAVLQAAADGDIATETAERLYIAEQTVKTYRKRIIAKLGARNLHHAVAIGLRTGLIV